MTLKSLLGAASALALLSGVAIAQQTDSTAGATDQTMTPPAAGAADAVDSARDQATDTMKGAADAMSGQADDSSTAATETTPPATDSGAADTTAETTETTPPAADSGAADTTAETTETTPPAAGSGSDAATTTAAPDTTTTTTDTTTTTATDQTTAEPVGEPVAASDLMGKDVVGRDGEDIGTVSDLVVDSETGEVKQVVIKSGGFLGLGGKKVAVDRDQIEIVPNQGVQADIAKADVETMPEWDDDSVASLDEPPPPPATGGTPGMPAPATPGATQ